MENNNSTFIFTYSAKQQDEVRRIQEKYLPKKADKLEQLRKLDSDAEKPATIAAIAVGTVGTLLLGLGMCFAMVWVEYFFLCLIGIPGIVLMAAAFPLYSRVVKKQREKLAPRILALTEELMHNK